MSHIATSIVIAEYMSGWPWPVITPNSGTSSNVSVVPGLSPYLSIDPPKDPLSGRPLDLTGPNEIGRA